MEHCIVKKIYIGNLPWSATEAELTEMFTKFGPLLAPYRKGRRGGPSVGHPAFGGQT